MKAANYTTFLFAMGSIVGAIVGCSNGPSNGGPFGGPTTPRAPTTSTAPSFLRGQIGSQSLSLASQIVIDSYQLTLSCGIIDPQTGEPAMPLEDFLFTKAELEAGKVVPFGKTCRTSLTGLTVSASAVAFAMDTPAEPILLVAGQSRTVSLINQGDPVASPITAHIYMSSLPVSFMEYGKTYDLSGVASFDLARTATASATLPSVHKDILSVMSPPQADPQAALVNDGAGRVYWLFDLNGQNGDSSEDSICGTGHTLTYQASFQKAVDNLDFTITSYMALQQDYAQGYGVAVFTVTCTDPTTSPALLSSTVTTFTVAATQPIF